jgi:hypothetical protein
MMLGPLVPCELLGTLDDDDDACGFVRVERLRVRCERVEICDSEGCAARSIAQWIAMLLTPRRPESALKGPRAHSNERLTVDLYP